MIFTVRSRRSVRMALLASAIGCGMVWPVMASAQADTQQSTAPQDDSQTADPAKDPAKSSANKAAQPDIADIVVTGQRLGFSTTSQIKRDAPQSVSVLTTADLRNIPDTILVDIVRRIPGVQVSQGGGGGIVSVRGLSQVEVRLNGRNFPSAVNRNFDISTLPGDLVSGVAVYKTPTADQIEGGVGGIVDFRTRRPFDFDGLAGSLTAKGVYTNLDDKVDPVISGYLSNRWQVGDGDLGAIIGGSFQRQRNTLHLLTTDDNFLQTNAGGTAVQAPSQIYKRYYVNDKDVASAYGALQWRNNGGLEMALDLLYNNSKNVGGLQNLAALLFQGTPATPFSLYPSSNIFRSGSYTNVPLDSSTNRFRGELSAFQAGYSASYTQDRATISTDIAYTRTVTPFSGGYVVLRATAPSLTYNADQKYPTFAVAGIDPKAVSNYQYLAYGENSGKDKSNDIAARIDGTYTFDGFLRAVVVGLRYQRRTVNHTFGFTNYGAPAGIGPVTQDPFVGLTPDDLYESAGIPQPQWVTTAYRGLDFNGGGGAALRSAFNGAPVTDDPASPYNGAEKTLTSYAMGKFVSNAFGIPIDGNVGVRIVKTDLSITATTSGPNNTRLPLTNASSYVDILPNVNVRLTLADNLFLRLAYSKQSSRPAFPQLAPITFLNFTDQTGSSGNPNLRPLRANQFDVSLEHYFGRDNSIYVAGFYKDVNGFVRNDFRIVPFNGVNYRLSSPVNLGSGYVAGAELGYRQTFSFLPGALSGLGLQGSYTFVEGTKQPNPAGFIVPYEQITKHNYNIGGFYNKYGIIANVNWVWRSRLLEASSSGFSGRPDYRIPFGQLDANLIYALTPKVNLIVSGVNLTQSLIKRSFEDSRFFAQNALENRRILAGVQIKLGGGI